MSRLSWHRPNLFVRFPNIGGGSSASWSSVLSPSFPLRSTLQIPPKKWPPGPRNNHCQIYQTSQISPFSTNVRGGPLSSSNLDRTALREDYELTLVEFTQRGSITDVMELLDDMRRDGLSLGRYSYGTLIDYVVSMNNKLTRQQGWKETRGGATECKSREGGTMTTSCRRGVVTSTSSCDGRMSTGCDGTTGESDIASFRPT